MTQRPVGVKNNKPLTYGTDFVVSDSGSKLNLVQLKPRNPSSYYMLLHDRGDRLPQGQPRHAAQGGGRLQQLQIDC